MSGNRTFLVLATFKGGVRDRLLSGVFVAALLLLFTMPLFSSFSMREVTGVALTYSLSVVSAVGVLFTLFAGGNLIARDIQSRTIYSIATLPVSRTSYLLQKYLGFALLLLCAVGILGVLNLAGLYFMAAAYPPDRPIAWANYLLCLLFDYEKLLLLSSVLILCSSFATSTFLPVLLTLAVYAVGESTEKVKFFIETVNGVKNVSPSVRAVSQVVYYVFPNLSLFDLKSQAIYSLPPDAKALCFTAAYGVGYCTVMLVLACITFAKRDFV